MNQQATVSAAGAITRVRYSHDAMIDTIIAEPHISQKELASRFGYTETWVSRVMCSDAFAMRLEQRRGEIIDPALVASVEERLKGLAMQATDVIAQRLEQTRSPELATKALEIASKALGFGARNNQPVINNNFVVAMPQKMESADEWRKAHGPRTVDVTPAKET